MALAVPTVGKEIGNSLLGRVSETAKIIINDYRALRDAKAETERQRVATNNANILEATENQLAGPVLQIPALPESLDSLQEQSTKGNHQIRQLVFEVQFNPSELSLNASALTINKQSVGVNDGERAAQMDQNVSSATVNMNVNLIFDKMNETEAFQLETGTYGAAGAVTSIATAVAAQTRNFSVRPEVEALMAALRDKHTREIAFVWNAFKFTGQLQFVQARYTMFSPAGHPVRATVAIRMKREATCNDEWVEEFETVFSGAGGQVLSRTQQYRYVNM